MSKTNETLLNKKDIADLKKKLSIKAHTDSVIDMLVESVIDNVIEKVNSKHHMRDLESEVKRLRKQLKEANDRCELLKLENDELQESYDITCMNLLMASTGNEKEFSNRIRSFISDEFAIGDKYDHINLRAVTSRFMFENKDILGGVDLDTTNNSYAFKVLFIYEAKQIFKKEDISITNVNLGGSYWSVPCIYGIYSKTASDSVLDPY